MIEKNIYFTWFGNTVPDFAKFSMEAFSHVNPSFSIRLIHKTVGEIEEIFYSTDISVFNIEDKLIYEAGHEFYESAVKKECWNWNNPFIPSMNDLFRCKLCQHLGGIYLDCDTFPLKPFDDKLLNLGAFQACRSFDDFTLCTETNFYGCLKEGWNIKNTLLMPIMEKQLCTKDLRDKFYSCTLKYGEGYGDKRYNYVDHYQNCSWHKDTLKCQMTKIDKMLKLALVEND